MDLSRTKAKKIAMIIFYQDLLCQKNNINTNIDELISSNVDEENEYIESIVKGVIENYNILEESANKYLNNWTLDRLGLTDQAIILIALYELKFTSTPSLVVINEAIELSKQYSDIAVSKMINGLLDKFYHLEIEGK